VNHSGYSGDPRDGTVSDLSFSSSPFGQLSDSGLAIKGRSGGDSEVSSGHHMMGTFILIPDLAGTLHLDHPWLIYGTRFRCGELGVGLVKQCIGRLCRKHLGKSR
jgi:hypothetical protein